jgi:hypothetical protein
MVQVFGQQLEPPRQEFVIVQTGPGSQATQHRQGRSGQIDRPERVRCPIATLPLRAGERAGVTGALRPWGGGHAWDASRGLRHPVIASSGVCASRYHPGKGVVQPLGRGTSCSCPALAAGE